MAAGTARLRPYIALVAVLLVVATVAGERSQTKKVKKRSVETPIDAHVQGSDVRVVKRGEHSETELSRVKRFKRHTPDDDEPELERTKRFKRDSPNNSKKNNDLDQYMTDETQLKRVKRNRRDADTELHRYKRQKRAVSENDEPVLSRQRRVKRDLKVKTVHQEDSRVKRSGKKAGKLESEPKGSKRADLVKRKTNQETKRHLKKPLSRRMEKHHEAMNKEYPVELHQKGRLDDIVKKAMLKFKRSKHRPKHGKINKGHRSKRAGHLGIKESSQILKDITRDISRLQRLRRGIARNVINSVKSLHANKHH